MFKFVAVLLLIICTSASCDRFKKANGRTFEGFEKDKNSQWIDDFTFIQATDPQFGLTYAADNNFTNQGNTWEFERAFLRQAITEWNSLVPAPKFIVITGDLVNSFPSKNATLRRTQLDDLRSELEKVNVSIPLVLLSGNHDLEDSPTDSAVTGYTQEFGDDYFSFAVGGVYFLVLNSQYYKDHTLVSARYTEQNQWLDRELAEVASGQHNYTHAICFQHIPWFFSNIDEPVDDTFTIPVLERHNIITKLYESGKIRHIFAGHYHRNAVGKYADDLEMVTTSATGWQNDIGGPPNAKPGYRVVRVTRSAVTHEYVNISDNTNGVYQIQLATRVWVFISLAFISVLVYIPRF